MQKIAAKMKKMAAILREKLRQNDAAKLRENCEKIAQNMRENCAYVITISKNVVFKDFCVGNTLRYNEVIGTAMFWHKIKAWCFVLCVLGES